MNNYNQIDLNKVKEKIIEFAAIDDSKSFIMSEEVPFNPLVIKRNINETKEILSLLKNDINISFDGIINVNDLLDSSKKGFILNPKELSNILNFHNHAKRIKDILDSVDNEYSIKDYSDSISLNQNMANQINIVVDNNGNIKEDASSRLKQIISDININEQRLMDKAHEFISRHSDSLQEATIYERNGRVTFLIKNSDKNKYNGYTYGTSASNLATYVEPEVLIKFNNERNSLLEDKEEEIKRLLKDLTYLVSLQADEYKNNFESLMKLDAVYAKAKYGFKNIGILATLSDDLYLKDVCHPLISLDNVVSNTYSLNKPYKGIVISGTNTGGKTVGLKCIGLSVLETYLGIPLIASEARVPLYDNVFVDIDDNQSISNSLSTFSAHISNINKILSNATYKSLILIDELISGTDPKEAQAISLAILNKIEEISSSFVITTHYDDIKNYAYKNEEILLSAVGFDNVNLKPTYKYVENTVGLSNALEIASRYFSDKSIISYAKNVLTNSSSNEEKLMNKLALQIEENQKLTDRLTKELNHSETLKKELDAKIKEFENSKLDLKNKYEKELNDYINDIKDKAYEKLDSIKEKKDAKVVEAIDNLKVSITSVKKVEFKIGDNVKVGTNDRIGTIDEISGSKVVVNINGMTIKTDKSNLTLMPKQNKNVAKTNYVKPKSVKKELNVVGMHIDEALIELDPFLDNAMLNNLTSVKVIHGIGTGQLRSAIRDRLKKSKFVKSFSDGDFYDGGSAVTLVFFK